MEAWTDLRIDGEGAAGADEDVVDVEAVAPSRQPTFVPASR